MNSFKLSGKRVDTPVNWPDTICQRQGKGSNGIHLTVVSTDSIHSIDGIVYNEQRLFIGYYPLDSVPWIVVSRYPVSRAVHLTPPLDSLSRGP